MSVVQGDSPAGMTRRQAIGRTAAVAAAGVVATAGTPAIAADDSRLRTFEGHYAISGSRVVHAYVASRRGFDHLDVMVIVPGEGGLTDDVRALARRHALGGKIVFAPDLHRSYAGSFASRDAMVADLSRHAAGLRNHGRGTGRVTVVAA